MKLIGESTKWLVVGMLVICGAIDEASADPALTNVDGQIHAMADGSLVALRPDAPVAVRYAHKRALVASDCVSLELRHRAGGPRRAVLHNHCGQPVALSYCVDHPDVDTHACRAIGRRTIGTQRVDPGADLPLGTHVSTHADVHWVACRTDAAAVSLMEDGTYGECLGGTVERSVAPTPVAVTDRAP